MAKILILGSNGQLGSDLTKVFTNSGHEVLGCTRQNFDVEKNSIKDVISDKKYDYVINCISYHKTDECEDFPQKCFLINSAFVAELAQLCRTASATLIHISTDYVFDGRKGSPYLESDAPNPLNLYGISKAAGEFAVRNYLDKYFIFRVSSLFGVAGASGKGGNFVETMLNLAKKGTDLKVIADQFMAPTHTLDIARAIKTFIDRGVDDYGVYHCSNSGSCSWHEFTKKIFELTGTEAKLGSTTYAEYKTKARRPQYSVLANTKLCRQHEMPHWEKALREYLALKGYL